MTKFSFKSWLEQQQPTDWDAYFLEMEPKLLANPTVQQELAQNFAVTIRTIQKEFGLPEGPAAFLSRMLNKKHGNAQKMSQVATAKMNAQYEAKTKDNYLYHVTTRRNLAKIRRKGLLPGMDSQFSNYSDYSKDRIFLSEKGGVEFWKQRVEEHEFHNGKASAIVVLKIPKQVITGLQNDDIGTRDSGYPSYFITQPIPAQYIEMA